MSQGREAIVKRGPGRPPRHSYARLAESDFKFKTGDLVLVKWTDGMVYFAKIKRIDYKRQKCVVVFDDKSQDEAHFRQIHSVDETTTDIICIKCKKDDSDKPNEIVLCDMCGIGFHQKCHIPNIPASALELSTPWNCSYCQKGVKCPYLTESLDVLQNLLSDDECSGNEDNTDATVVFDSDHYEPDLVDDVTLVSSRKKRGRKPATESTVAMKRERRKAHRSHIVGPHQSSSIVTMDFRPHPSEAWKPKPYNMLSSEDGDSEPVYISSGKSTPEPSPAPAHSAQAGVKRKRRHHGITSGSGGGAGGGGHVKKQKRSSVESRTVSVTRVSLPVYDSSSAEEMDTSRDSSVCESSFSSGHGLDSIKEESVVHERRPRSLRVSLSIPEEVEPGTPFDKVMRVHHQRVSSPQHHPSSAETKELPSWENFENSNLLHRASSQKERPQTLPTEKPDIRFPKSNTANVKPAPETAVAASSKNAAAPAFLASPLPISSSPKLSHPPPAVVTPSAPGANVKATSSPSPSSSSSSLEVGVKDNKGAGLQSSGTSGPPLPAAVDVGYSAPTPSPDVVVATKPSTVAVTTPQTEVNNLTPSSLPPQKSPHPPSQPQPQLTKPASSSVATTPASPSGIAQSSTNSTMLSPATKPAVFPTVTAAPNPIPVSSGVPLTLQPQQQSVVVSSGHHQPRPLPTSSTTVPPSKCSQHVLVPQQQKPAHQQQQQPSATSQTGLKTPPAQQIPSVPLVHSHQGLAAVSVAQSPNATRQQVLVTATSRPSIIPIQQPAVVNSQRPANAPMQQQVVSRPSSNVHAPAVNQSPLQQQHQHQQQRHQQQQRQVYIASTRPTSVPGPGQQQPQQVITTMARPSSVPIQQHRPPSVPSQSPQQAVIVAPPRPSSVPMQKGAVLSHSQSRSPPVSTPTQHMLVAYSQSGVKQVVERQPPPYVGKGQSTAVFQASASTPTYVLTHASPVNVQHGSPVVQTQRQIQEPVAKKPTVQSSGDADVIITGVESTNRVNKGQNVGYHAAVTQSGEKIVILNTNRGATVPYQTTAVSTPTGPGTVRKAIPKNVDVTGQMAPSGPTLAPSLPTAVSGQSQFVSTPVGSHAPASVVPVVLAPATNSVQLPMSTITSPVVYRVATDPAQVVQPQSQLVASATQAQVARGARDTSMRAVASVNTTPADTRAAQVVANSQSATPVIVACQPVTFSTTKPYAIVNAMPGSQIPAAALPHPPRTYSLVSEKQTTSSNSTNKLQHREVVRTISKKIGDAFDSGNEQLLVAAFEDAWKRFQANGKQYEPGVHNIIVSSGTKVVGKEPPPNAEVFSVPGTASRVSLVRQTSSNRAVLPPKSSSLVPVQQVIAPPPLSSKEQSSYVYTAATNTAQPQVYLQPITTGQQPLSHAKIHSSGLFYPPNSSENVAVLQKKAQASQRVVVSQSSSVVRHSGSGSGSVREPSGSQGATHKRRRSSGPQYCANCGKSATYQCAGCHREWYCGRECQLKAWDTHAEHCEA